jgi:hypothetical protein
MKHLKLFENFNKMTISENVKYHLDNKINFTKNIFRTGSESFYNLLEEVRYLFDTNQIVLESLDRELYEKTDIGRFGYFNGQKVPLDIPMISEEGLSPQVKGDKVFSIHDKKEGDLVKVEGEYVRYIKPNSWVKDKNANCIEFSAEFNGKEINIKYDDGCDAYVFESLYKGKKVKLNKPMRSSGPKKYKVYVKDPKTGNVKVVNFGDMKGGLTAKVNDPEARKSFVARHKCDRKWKPEDKLKPSYWSCRLPKFKNLVSTDFSGYW